jgi:tetratricopeptide (TPR) repeat protein
MTLQADVARAISHAVQVTLTPQEEKRFGRARVVVPAAHEAYLKGLQRWNRRESGEVFQAIDLFRQAIALDSTFAKPHAALADAYNFLGNYSAISQAVAYGTAKAEALRALEIDPDLGEAYVSLALVKMEFEWDWVGAERDYRRAIELNPGYATAHQYYAEFLARMGRNEEALASIDRALALDPLSPPMNGMKGTVHYYGREPEKAIEQYRKTLALREGQVLTRFCLGLTFLQLKRYPEAIIEFKRSVEDSRGAPLMMAGLGCAYGLAGHRADAKRILEELRTLSRTTPVAPSCLSLVCLGLGDKEGTLRYMEEALQTHDSYVGHLKVLPLVDGIRSEPRFVEILRRAGLGPGA